MVDWRKYIKFLPPALILISILVYFVWSYIDKAGKTKPVIIPEHTSDLAETTSSFDSPATTKEPIFIDVSGAVQNPGLHQLFNGDRVADALKVAGGVSQHASTSVVSKVLNLSRKLSDGEKLYIPFIFDEASNQAIALDLDPLCIGASNTTNNDKNPQASSGTTNTSSSKTNVNTASRTMLVALPGIGEVLADKILANRPYKSIDEFYEKMHFSASLKEKLLDILLVE